MLIGKPNENRFNCGADRVITPMTRLIASKKAVIGSMIMVAARNIDPAAAIPPCISRGKAGIAPTGRYSYESATARNTIKCPFHDRKITVKNNENVLLTTGVWPPESGSICAAKPRPAELAIFSPARSTAENQMVRISPEPMPMASSVIIT